MSKARPVIIMQSDKIDSFKSIIICPLTSFDSHDISTRVFIPKGDETGISKDSFAMTDKLMVVLKNEFGQKLGELDSRTLDDVEVAIKIVLDL